MTRGIKYTLQYSSTHGPVIHKELRIIQSTETGI